MLACRNIILRHTPDLFDWQRVVQEPHTGQQSARWGGNCQRYLRQHTWSAVMTGRCPWRRVPLTTGLSRTILPLLGRRVRPASGWRTFFSTFIP